MNRSRLIALGLLIGCAWCVAAQPTPKPSGPTGTVVGRVTFAETRLAARYAEVTLVRRPADKEIEALSAMYAPSMPSVIRVPEKHPDEVVSVAGRTGIDGSFRIEDVPVGDYVLVPQLRGFLAVAGEAAASDKPAAELRAMLAALPSVHVALGQVAQVDGVLHKGGVITGRVLFEDGSPAVGVRVSSESPGVEGRWFTSSIYAPLAQALGGPDHQGSPYSGTQTDDEGRYRLVGLSPGKYRVQAWITTEHHARSEMLSDRPGSLHSEGGSPGEICTVYLPGVFRHNDAKQLEVHAGEVISDADLAVNLSSLRVVRGRIVQSTDVHLPLQAFVELKEPNEPEGGGFRANANEDGTFSFDFVPPSTYTLKVQDMSAAFAELDAARSAAAEEGGTGGRVSSVGMLVSAPPGQRKVERTVVVGDQDVVVEDVLLPATVKPNQSTSPQ
jgi:hypothetical protein